MIVASFCNFKFTFKTLHTEERENKEKDKVEKVT